MGELKGWGKAVSELFPLKEDTGAGAAKGIGGAVKVDIPSDAIVGDLAADSISSGRLTIAPEPFDWATTTLEVRGAPIHDTFATADMVYGSWEWERRREEEVNGRVCAGAEDALAIIEKRGGIKRTTIRAQTGGSVTGVNEQLGRSAVLCGAQLGAGDVIWEIRKEIERCGINDLNDLLGTLDRIESEWDIVGKIRKVTWKER